MQVVDVSAIEQNFIFELLNQYAYDPLMVYSIIVVIMFLSSLGLPLPEEITIISVGILAHISHHPNLYPPPEVGLTGIDMYTAAMVCFLAVFVSDFVIYGLGRTGGRSLVESRYFSRLISSERLSRVERWTQKYGYWAVGVFRFTPGLRFPGHFACGVLRFSPWKFALIDGGAALLTVPTQIILMAIYGNEILEQLNIYKYYLGGAAVALIVLFVFRLVWINRKAAT